MEKIKGKGVFGGIAIGKLLVYQKKENQIKRYHVADTEAEKKRFEAAKAQAREQLARLYEKALKEVGETNAMIFEVHQMMLEDLDYLKSIINLIETQNVNAEYAVGTTADHFSAMFASMEDDYMRGRAADIKDVSERVLACLAGREAKGADSDEPFILCADDLAPSETVQLDKNKVLAFVTRFGSSNSHTAILARTMNIPAVIGASLPNPAAELDGRMAVVNGYTGELILDPDAKTLAAMEQRRREDRDARELLLQLRGKENVTKDGRIVNVFANIGNPGDLAAVLKNDAGGVGLFRSEFLYLEKDDFPTEEEQFEVYKTVVQNMAGKKVIIRTLDIGADKQADYFGLEKEDNPAMGYRAIRICLDRPDIFKTQLRAIYRASAFGNLSIMFPMITSLKEIREIKAIAGEVRRELREQGIRFLEHTELGIMIETPAAVMISDDLAKEVDFFSVGTNDLTQYTLAIDRQNAKLDPFYDSHHKAILRMLKITADNAHKNGIWMGICGELGADLSLTETFLSIGVDEFSVSPGLVLPLRKKIRETDVSGVRNACLNALL